MKTRYLIVLNWLFVSTAVLLAAESDQPIGKAHENVPVEQIAWHGFEKSWNEVYLQTILGVEDERQKLDKLKESVELKEFIEYFFTRHYVSSGEHPHIVKVPYDELKQIGRFLYDMSNLYDDLYPDKLWGVPKIQSPVDDDKWTGIWFRIMERNNIQCLLSVHFAIRE